MLASAHNLVLVLPSILIAILASYTALGMAGRIAAARGRAAYGWLVGGACAMGIGIWAMHFVGMLAFSLPIPLGYDPVITALSLLIAIASSAFALWLVTHDSLPWHRLLAGALLMGSGIISMHYTGMAALRMSPGIQYIPSLFVASIAIAIGVSGIGLWMAFHLRRRSSHEGLLRVGAALIMGLAIAGMHYTGMAAAEFPAGSICGAAGAGVDSGWLALVVIVITMAVLGIALVTSVLDLRLESRTAKLAESLASANEKLRHRSLHDSLTNLPNRVLLEDRLKQRMHAADLEQKQFALMFMDLDGFKAVNDAYGHHVGDSLLVQVARRVLSEVRQQDTIARLGGDEFVLLTGLVEPDDAARLAESMLSIIRRPFQLAGHELRISTSIGIVMYPRDGASQHDLLTNADAAMYHSKSLGHNTYCFFQTSMVANAQQQLLLLQDLRLAMERQEFDLYYQAKVDAKSGGIIGAEALLRWHHPVRGLILPDAFIPAAERSGMIVQLGAWVLGEACRQLQAWHDQGYGDMSVAVNLSGLQFGHTGLVGAVRDALQRNNLEPRHLTLEVTETVAMRDADASILILRQLNDAGVRIAIDDFGTGYSSLLYLKRLPAHELKIDRGFVRELPHNAEDAAIVSAILALGHTLNLLVVAEGVETIAQQRFLTALGCDSLQGYLFGRPLPSDQFQYILHSSLRGPSGV
ncbi:hypothetical protein CR155_14980 [Pollutimonas nitritireducens]|uniref:Diguanylate cyclase/phosphodiesterase n=1 Tax=Pollutimonas nitritireducens TaxID=2045209 RepID=A0A2N4UDL9_9BURK|nr:EAL domain-containing protein [Pollutimonas nitritireducens]PLC53101.1 hypothetical protein CR155_14980 [Pollutimonas nitritireducens]